jgi:hypothetical protein
MSTRQILLVLLRRALQMLQRTGFLMAIAVAAGLGLASSSGYAYSLADFESGTQGYNPSPSAPAGSTTTVHVVGDIPGDAGAATSPTHYLDVNVAQGGFWGPRSRNLVLNPADRAALIANHTLEYDLTLSGVALSGGNSGYSGFAQSNELAVTMFGDGGAFNLFIQRSFAAGGATDSSGQSATWSGVDGTRHITWNLDNFTATDPILGGTKTVSQLIADHPELDEVTIWNVAQTGGDASAGNADFFFDSVALTPEPATLGLAALALPMALRRRRR